MTKIITTREELNKLGRGTILIDDIYGDVYRIGWNGGLWEMHTDNVSHYPTDYYDGWDLIVAWEDN